MTKGDIHYATGTICQALSNESCPYGAGHADSLESYSIYHGVDENTLKDLVENEKMKPKDAIELIRSGEMEETLSSITKDEISPEEEIITGEMEIAAQDFHKMVDELREKVWIETPPLKISIPLNGLTGKATITNELLIEENFPKSQ